MALSMLQVAPAAAPVQWPPAASFSFQIPFPVVVSRLASRRNTAPGPSGWTFAMLKAAGAHAAYQL
ncbi:MAG: hypothetical protein AAGG79_05000, partial [Pseudomonadota bacterium]